MFHVVSVYLTLVFHNFNISQCRVATHMRCGGVFYSLCQKFTAKTDTTVNL